MWPVINFGDWLTRRFDAVKESSKYDISPSLSLNGTAFTPDELRDKTVNRSDRHYAFLAKI